MTQNDKMILVTGCSDSLMWYKTEVGSFFALIKEYEDCYLTREPSGFTNIIRKQDAKLVSLDEMTQGNKFDEIEQEIVDLIQEECAELIQSISKVRRFGRTDNVAKMCAEMADLNCLITLAKTYIPEVGMYEFDKAEAAKLEKLRKYSRIFSS